MNVSPAGPGESVLPMRSMSRVGVTEAEVHRVLIVEDDQDTCLNLQDILELDGYAVTILGTAAALMSLPDIGDHMAVVLDRRLPDGTADELLPQLQSIAPAAAVVLITGYADLDGAINALRDGASDFLTKPVNPDRLRATLSRIRQLREAELRAQRAERLAAIGVVVAGVAHESRNAMQRIQARVDLMRLSLDDNPELLADLDAIEQANRRLSLLYDELREFAAPIHLAKRDCCVAELIKNVWSDLSVHPKHAGASLKVRSAGCVCRVDPLRIEQVFRNLLENAIAACPGPVKVLVRCRPIRWRGREMLEISVRDNGPGLPSDQVPMIFEPFFTTKCEGTGLGLAISRRIIDLHDGQLIVAGDEADAEYPGAEFLVRLPAGDNPTPCGEPS